MKGILASLCGHAAVLMLVAFTFPPQPGPAGLTRQMIYGGEVFSGPASAVPAARPEITAPARLIEHDRVIASGDARVFSGLSEPAWIKPVPVISAVTVKSVIPGPELVSKPLYRDPVLILHPSLPSQLELYFKDRQEVHIELLFNINADQEGGSIELKRRISSGNLQADLLSKRYLSHYLFIQRARFAPQQWLPVKIDLSGENYDTH